MYSYNIHAHAQHKPCILLHESRDACLQKRRAQNTQIAHTYRHKIKHARNNMTHACSVANYSLLRAASTAVLHPHIHNNNTLTKRAQPLKQVQESSEQKLLSSFQGSFPSEQTATVPDMIPADQEVLNQLFHPGGKDAPDADWFILRLSGPGTPERIFGEFVWTRSVRYLVIPAWLLDVVSVGLLRPGQGEGSSGLMPAFCPALIDQEGAMFNDRLVQMRTLLTDSIQKQPGGAIKAFPASSVLSFVPTSGLPRIFVPDPDTNKVEVKLVYPWDYQLLILMLGFAFGFPLIGAIVITIGCYRAGYQYAVEFCEKKLLEEQLTVNIGKALRKGNETLAKEDFLGDIDEDLVLEVCSCRVRMHVCMCMHIQVFAYTNMSAQYFLGDVDEQLYSRCAQAACACMCVYAWDFLGDIHEERSRCAQASWSSVCMHKSTPSCMCQDQLDNGTYSWCMHLRSCACVIAAAYVHVDARHFRNRQNLAANHIFLRVAKARCGRVVIKTPTHKTDHRLLLYNKALTLTCSIEIMHRWKAAQICTTWPKTFWVSRIKRELMY
jgi:hypothetical protein